MRAGRWIALLLAGISPFAFAADSTAPSPKVEDDGTISVPTFELPFSSFASREARESTIARLRNGVPAAPDIAKTRQLVDAYLAPQLAEARKLFPCRSKKAVMGGVPVEVFEPESGIAPENKDRVLMELHGGGFIAGGGGAGGAVGSVPIAGTGRIKVVSVDYRQAPEHRFPAASEDLAAVYRDLLGTYEPGNIGIFGCSAGGMLAAAAIPWFLKERLPLPGAIAVLCASTHTFEEGDSAQLWPRMGSVIRSVPPKAPGRAFGPRNPYFANVSPRDPLAIPSASRDVLKAFPPTLFLTGTRAPEMSAAAQSHLELMELGVSSELLLFDGLDHSFLSDPSLPESVLAYKLITRFFANHLGSARGSPGVNPAPVGAAARASRPVAW